MNGRELDGYRAVVTGSARNIGREIALELARAGAAVVVNARSARSDAEHVAGDIRAAGGRAAVVVADISTPGGADEVMRACATSFGGLDILVNNAAVRREVDFAQLDYAEWREVLGATLDGAFLCSHAALPHLIAAGGRGTIVNIGGMSAHAGAARRSHVLAAKAGLVGLTRGLAHDLAPHGITVNCVAPGLIDTVRRGAPPGHHTHRRPLVDRRGSPMDVAAMVRYLCGPAARYVTGQTVHVNGGAYLGA